LSDEFSIHNCFVLEDTIRMIKLRRMRWAGQLASMHEGDEKYVETWKAEGKRSLFLELGIVGRIMLK
jgi:hypothetical protein